MQFKYLFFNWCIRKRPHSLQRLMILDLKTRSKIKKKLDDEMRVPYIGFSLLSTHSSSIINCIQIYIVSVQDWSSVAQHSYNTFINILYEVIYWNTNPIWVMHNNKLSFFSINFIKDRPKGNSNFKSRNKGNNPTIIYIYNSQTFGVWVHLQTKLRKLLTSNLARK